MPRSSRCLQRGHLALGDSCPIPEGRGGHPCGATAEVMVLNFVIDFICFLLQEQFSDLQKIQSILFY